MKKILLAMFLVLLFFGALIVFTPSSTACHNKTVTVSPGTEQDITDIDTYMVQYEIDVKCTPGCGSQYWVGFTADPAPNGWSRIMYKKGDATKTNILGTGTPPDGDHNNWNDWISIGSGSEVHYIAILEVKVTNKAGVENGDQATITVHCWSCDVVPNDREDDPVTTVTTLNIPHGIRVYHTVSYMATQWTEPGEWATFDLTIRDIGNASGLIDLSKDPMSTPCLVDKWDWELSQTPVDLPDKGTVSFQLKVKPPITAEYGDFAIFIVKGVSRADTEKFKHSVGAKTIVTVPLPDLAIKSSDMKCLVDDPCDSDKVNLSIDVWNLGDKDVSNFEISFGVSDPGAEEDIETILVTDTLKPDKKITVKAEWIAIEGDHSLCVHADEKELITEKDEEGNNEAGIILTVGPAKPKKIILTIDISPTSCMPGSDFTVSGKARYNKEYDSLPVTNTNVQIKIVETGKIFNTKTDKDGKFTKDCSAPNDENRYKIQISINKDGISAKKSSYIDVSSFVVSSSVNPRTVESGKKTTISGSVSDKDGGIAAVDITIEILDGNDKVVITHDITTDTDGNFINSIFAPIVTEHTEFTIKTTAIKGEISGATQTIFFVDVNTDGDDKVDSEDDDDDNDGYPDSVEKDAWTDPLDDTDKPSPEADAGVDQTINEGDEVTLSGDKSWSDVSELEFTWDFGDDIDDEKGSTVTHQYNKNGKYTVRLIVKDDYDQTDIDTITITVNDLSPTVTIDGDSSGETDLLLSFTATATSVIDDIKSYTWDFDDGETGTGQSIFHEWSEAGSYDVIVTVKDNDGSTATDTFEVEITAKPSGSDGTGSRSTGADYGLIYMGILVIIVVVILLALFLLMRKKTPSETQPSDSRVAGSNIGAQSSRRPTTPFAEADIKPTMGTGAQPQKMAMPGTVPQQPVVASQPQRSQLPPAPKQQQPPQQSNQSKPQEQKDWNWNFNE